MQRSYRVVSCELFLALLNLQQANSTQFRQATMVCEAIGVGTAQHIQSVTPDQLPYLRQHIFTAFAAACDN
jgi:hypothetical protein